MNPVCECGCGGTPTPGRRFVWGHNAARSVGGLNFDRVHQRWRVVSRDGSHVHYARAVMAGELKRTLLPNEHVHHINGDTTDDRIENLQLLSQADHARLHIALRRKGWRFEWSENYTCCSDCGTTERRHKARGFCDACYSRVRWSEREAA